LLFILMTFPARLPAADQIASDARKIAAVAAGAIMEAKASWWGFNPEDSTAALQAAIDSGVSKLIVNKMAGPWIITPIRLASDQEIVFEEGVEVLAKRGAFQGKNASLFRATNLENITLSGYGATWRMWRDDYDNRELYEKAEWRMCLAIGGCTNVKVLGLTLTESGGDGIYLGAGEITNKDILIKDVTCDRNYRQGISIITAENLLIEGCTLSNTDGTNPRAGIDFEPNHPKERLVNCVMRDCVMKDNAGNGIALYLNPMDATSEEISIRFENCRCIGNRESARFSVAGTIDGAPDGIVEFVDCLFESPTGTAIGVSKPATRGRVRFIHCSIINPAAKQTGLTPIEILSHRTASVPAGGVEFVDCVIRDQVDRYPMNFVDGGGVGLEDVTGSLIIETDSGRNTVTLTDEVLTEWLPLLTWKMVPRTTLQGLALKPLVEQADPQKYAFDFANVRYFGSFLLWAEEGDEIAFTVDYFQVGRYTGKPIDVILTAPSGAVAHRSSAAFQEKTEVSFTAPETGAYRLLANPTRNRLRITRTTHRVNLNGEGGSVRLIHGGGDYYFWVPAGTTEYAVRVCGEGAGEGIAAKLINFAGEVVEEVDNTAALHQFHVEQSADTPGHVWVVRITRPSAMAWEDHTIDLRGVPPVLAPSRDALLVPVE
jgi:hypothetical protein